jgi:hypothetical protein
MRRKWLQSLKRFIEQFTPGGTEYTKDGIAIVYSRTGRSTIPRSEYPKLWAHMQQELTSDDPPNIPAYVLSWTGLSSIGTNFKFSGPT